MTCSIVGNKPSFPNLRPWVVASDGPETGGISGNIKPRQPDPFVKEERPTTIDIKTGELVYLDEYLKDLYEDICCDY